MAEGGETIIGWCAARKVYCQSLATAEFIAQYDPLAISAAKRKRLLNILKRKCTPYKDRPSVIGESFDDTPEGRDIIPEAAREDSFQAQLYRFALSGRREDRPVLNVVPPRRHWYDTWLDSFRQQT